MAPSVNPTALAGKNIVITGEIDGHTRQAAQKILESAGAKFEKSLNKKVNLVVLGAKPGQNKLDKIEELGIETKEWDDVLAEIEGDGGDAGEDDDMKDEETGDDGEEEEEEEQEKKPAAKPKKAKAAPKAAPKVAPKTTKKSKEADVDDIPVSGNSSISGKTVIITGTIVGHDRKEAAALLEKAGATIAKSLNKSVEVVILGQNPGPDKLSKIEDMGVETVKWDDLAGELGVPVEEPPSPPPENPNHVSAPTDISGKTLLITGAIDGHTRSSAQKLLEEAAGAKFAKSLNKSVELVVLGSAPGPDKLKQIADMGIGTVTWTELAQTLNLPEGGEPPKKKSKKA